MSKQKLAQLKQNVAPYEKSDMKTSVMQLVNTFLPLLLFWFLAYQSLTISVWLTFGFAIVAAGIVIRIFIVFHDCCHGSFFKSKKMNNLVGTITGVITMFPYEKWKRDHSIHHATSGNLDKRGTGDIWVMTINEYAQASFMERLAYRLYRNPIFMFGLGPFYLFLITNRLNRKGARRKERVNTYVTNFSILAVHALLVWALGWQAVLFIQGPLYFVAGVLGIWLFYVQHQFEDSYFEEETQWDYVKAAVEGSSFYKLPKILQWVTGNIGFHHVHHLSPRVPNYYLEQAHEATPPLQHATTITLATSLKSIRFRLYDEENMVFVSFKDAKHILREPKFDVEIPDEAPSQKVGI
ncbi:fatty acid desaturase [bacterium LRH843]|nr:fatty acid desaturase [bacterium LRH843]